MKHEFTDEQIEAVCRDELNAWNRTAARLILEARAERDEAQKKYALTATLLEERSKEAQALFNSREKLTRLCDEARARVAWLERRFHRLGDAEFQNLRPEGCNCRICSHELEGDIENTEHQRDLALRFVEGQAREKLTLETRVAALEAELDEREREVLSWQAHVCPQRAVAQDRIAALEAENAALLRRDSDDWMSFKARHEDDAETIEKLEAENAELRGRVDLFRKLTQLDPGYERHEENERLRVAFERIALDGDICHGCRDGEPCHGEPLEWLRAAMEGNGDKCDKRIATLETENAELRAMLGRWHARFGQTAEAVHLQRIAENERLRVAFMQSEVRQMTAEDLIGYLCAAMEGK